MRESLLEWLRSPSEAPEASAPLRLAVFEHAAGDIREGALYTDTGKWWWIAAGVPRLTSTDLYRSIERETCFAANLKRLDLAPMDAGSTKAGAPSIEIATRDRFGAEWRMFREWGFLDCVPAGEEAEHRGGLWTDTLRAFRLKTFLANQLQGAVVLDAGCGNGRFTKAALSEGAHQVIAVDLGWGVDVAAERFRDDPRVNVVQASLLELPVAQVDAAFSIGVLMHTRDPRAALARIARAVKPDGLFAVRMYHKGNWAYEALDARIRSLTTRLSPQAQLRFARAMAGLGRIVESAEHRLGPRGLRMKVYQVVHNWPTVHHNLDWWSAPRASHHTVNEICRWGFAAQLEPVKTDPPFPGPEKWRFFEHPESLTALFRKQPAAVIEMATQHRAATPPSAALHVSKRTAPLEVYSP